MGRVNDYLLAKLIEVQDLADLDGEGEITRFFMTPSKIILCSTDASEKSYQLLTNALQPSPGESFDVCMLHVRHRTKTRWGEAAEAILAMRRKISTNEKRSLPYAYTTLHLGHENPGGEIVKLARERKTDLIVITVQHDLDETGWLGQEVYTVVRHAPCAVLVLKHNHKD